IGQGIEDMRLLAPPSEQAFRTQDAQPLRDGGELLVYGRDDLADAQLPLQKQGEDLQSGGIAHGAEDPSRRFQVRPRRQSERNANMMTMGLVHGREGSYRISSIDEIVQS